MKHRLRTTWDDYSARLITAGNAARVIRPWSSLKRGDLAIPCCRVSNRERKSNLVHHEAFLRRELRKRGVIVIDVKSKVISGFSPWWLIHAALLAKKHGAKLVALTTDRFIRNVHFDSKKRPDAGATEDELKDLRHWTLDAPLVTFLDPNASLSEVKSLRTKIGQEFRGNKGGGDRLPGHKKRHKEKHFQDVVELRARNVPLRDIAEITETPFETVRRWLREAECSFLADS